MKKLFKFAATAMSCAMILTAGIAMAGCNNSEGGNEKESTTINLTDTVTVEGGKIKGYTVEGNEEILSFKGIPYAAPPVGEYRWKRPQPVVSWEGVKDCKDFGNSAMQGNSEANEKDTPEFLVSNKNYSEDCLTLNVWAKAGETEKNKPVLVYVHGGAFISGGSSCEVYDGQNIAKEDVIFVSVNYRLGVFGWFASSELAEEDEEGSTGNYGLMDIIKSLEWVRDNISVFGGDGSNITLMGQSAGGNLVQTILTSPKAQGLIKNVVSNSYNNMTSNMLATASMRAESCKALGTLEELRALSAEQLLDKYGKNIMLVLATLGVCNDGVYVDKTLQEGLEEGRGSGVNVMCGMVWDNANNSQNDGSPIIGGPVLNIENMTRGEELMAGLTRIATARNVGNATGKTYLFDFAFPLAGPNKDTLGAFHSADLPYFFNYRTPLRAEYWTNDDIQVGKTVSSYLVNFCKTGNPNGGNLTTWEPNTGNYKYMWLDKVCELKSMTETQIKAFENAIQ